MKKIFISLCVMFSTNASYADTVWLNTSGTVEMVSVYETTDTILFKLNVSGAPVSNCSNTTTFAISGSAPVDRRKQMLSLLMSSRVSSVPITVTYSDDNCVPWDSNQNAYRQVRRLGM